MLGRKWPEDSRQAFSEHRKTHPTGSEFKLGHKSNLGKKFPETMRQKCRIANLGKQLSPEAKEKDRLAHLGKRASDATRAKMSLMQSREKNSNWKGGITPLTRRQRKNLEYYLWRSAVFKRDGFICQICGKRGGELHAHHILSFASFPECRLAINNGRTLCKFCHKFVHSREARGH